VGLLSRPCVDSDLLTTCRCSDDLGGHGTSSLQISPMPFKCRLADEEVGEVDKLAWERVQMVWAKRRKTIDERRRAAAKVIDT
jgi:hypothetical protein